MSNVRLHGVLAPAVEDREVTTDTAEVRFASEAPGEMGLANSPGLVVNKREFEDADPREIAPNAETLAEIDTIEELESAVDDLFESHAEYLEASDVQTPSERAAMAGLRKPRFFANIRAALDSTGLSEAQVSEAHSLLNRKEHAAFRNRTVEFSTANLDSYHPYSDPFDDGVEKLGELTRTDAERAAIDRILEYIADRKTTRGSSIDERNIEASVALRPVDRENDGQSVSLAEGSTNPMAPEYVVINVQGIGGMPLFYWVHANKSVVRDGDQYYFDGTGEPVPQHMLKYLVERPASDRLGVRLLNDGEAPRADFPYDWSSNGAIDVDKINTGWWGHCHIQAPLAAMDLSAGATVTVYDEGSGQTVTFSTAEINDLLFAMFDATSYMDLNGRYAPVSHNTFVGNRNDTTKSPQAGDELVVRTDRGTRSFQVGITSVRDETGEAVKLADAFKPTRLVDADGLAFEANPAFAGRSRQDWSTIEANGAMSMKVEYLDVTPAGQLTRHSAEVTIDPRNPGEPVILGSRQVGSGYPPKIEKFFYNVETGNIEAQLFAPSATADGATEMIAEGEPRIEGAVRGLSLRREQTAESIVEMHEELLRVSREGISLVADVTPSYAVWNYAVESISLEEVRREGAYAEIKATVRTQGSDRTDRYIVREDDDGNVIAAHPLTDFADFLWQPVSSASVPVYRDPDAGWVALNRDAYYRGYLADGAGNITDESVAFFRYASDVIYASLQDPDAQEAWVIRDDDGDLYLYEDEGTFERDSRKLDRANFWKRLFGG